MKLWNTVYLKGNLTRDPEVKGANGWIALTSIAHNKSIKKEDGTWWNEAHFFDLIAKWPDAVKKLTKYKKGNSILVTGELEQNKFEVTNSDGSKQQRFAIRIVIQEILPIAKNSEIQEEGFEDDNYSYSAPVESVKPSVPVVEKPVATKVAPVRAAATVATATVVNAEAPKNIMDSALSENDFMLPTDPIFSEDDLKGVWPVNSAPTPVEEEKDEFDLDDISFAPTDEDFLLN